MPGARMQPYTGIGNRRWRGRWASSFLLAALAFPRVPTPAAPKGIRAVYVEGKIAHGTYTNPYFGVTLTPVGGKFTRGAFISKDGGRARLADAQMDTRQWASRYEIAILADARRANPGIHSPATYVRAVLRALGRKGWETIHRGRPTTISGRRFIGALLAKRYGWFGPDRYRGISTTFLKGYIVSLEIDAGSLPCLREARRMVRFRRTAGRRGG